jgi:hypothetical protein
MSDTTPGAHAAGDSLGGDTTPDGTDGSMGADAPAGDAGLVGGPIAGDDLDQSEDQLDRTPDALDRDGALDGGEDALSDAADEETPARQVSTEATDEDLGD